MSLKAAFIFLAPEAEAAKHCATVRTPQVDLTVVGVANYTEAERAAKALIGEGIAAIELCGGFGVAGAARVARAVEGKAACRRRALRWPSGPRWQERRCDLRRLGSAGSEWPCCQALG